MALAVALALATTGARPAPPAPPPAQDAAPLGVPLTPDSALLARAVTHHVIVVSIDGLRPDAIEEFGLGSLQRLMDGGTYSLTAQTILPSKTLPSHTSMLTGVVPEKHGITWNSESDEHGIVRVPTIFELAKQNGLRTAAFYSKAKFRHLDRAGSYDYRQVPSSNTDNWMATRTVPEAIQYMRHERPNLLFVHIGESDYAGHTTGWMSFFYGLAVRRADAAVGRLVQAAEREYGRGEFTIIVTADHGGHDHTHGSDDPLDMTIPWILYGEGVADVVGPTDVRTMDTAATALWLLGVPVPGEFDGVARTELFEVPAVEAVATGAPSNR